MLGENMNRTIEDSAHFEETYTEVRYAETDQMGYAHHSTAVLWFEMGRIFWLRKHGLSYRKLESNGFLLPVVNLSIRYHAPARFEDSLVIEARLLELGKTRLTFENRVLRVETGSGDSAALRTLLVSGTVELACLDRNGRIQRIPPEIDAVWKKIAGNA